MLNPDRDNVRFGVRPVDPFRKDTSKPTEQQATSSRLEQLSVPPLRSCNVPSLPTETVNTNNKTEQPSHRKATTVPEVSRENTVRTWTRNNGRTMDAQLFGISRDGKTVILRDTAGNEHKGLVSALSAKDQRYIRDTGREWAKAERATQSSTETNRETKAVPVASRENEVRTWTKMDERDKRTVDAKLVSISKDGKTVTLRDTAGNEHQGAVSALSDKDQKYVRDKGQEWARAGREQLKSEVAKSNPHDTKQPVATVTEVSAIDKEAADKQAKISSIDQEIRQKRELVASIDGQLKIIEEGGEAWEKRLAELKEERECANPMAKEIYKRADRVEIENDADKRAVTDIRWKMKIDDFADVTDTNKIRADERQYDIQYTVKDQMLLWNARKNNLLVEKEFIAKMLSDDIAKMPSQDIAQMSVEDIMKLSDTKRDVPQSYYERGWSGWALGEPKLEVKSGEVVTEEMKEKMMLKPAPSERLKQIETSLYLVNKHLEGFDRVYEDAKFTNEFHSRETKAPTQSLGGDAMENMARRAQTVHHGIGQTVESVTLGWMPNTVASPSAGESSTTSYVSSMHDSTVYGPEPKEQVRSLSTSNLPWAQQSSNIRQDKLDKLSALNKTQVQRAVQKVNNFGGTVGETIDPTDVAIAEKYGKIYDPACCQKARDIFKYGIAEGSFKYEQVAKAYESADFAMEQKLSPNQRTYPAQKTNFSPITYREGTSVKPQVPENVRYAKTVDEWSSKLAEQSPIHQERFAVHKANFEADKQNRLADLHEKSLKGDEKTRLISARWDLQKEILELEQEKSKT